jgi:hypothetical protein
MWRTSLLGIDEDARHRRSIHDVSVPGSSSLFFAPKTSIHSQNSTCKARRQVKRVEVLVVRTAALKDRPDLIYDLTNKNEFRKLSKSTMVAIEHSDL